MENRKRILLKSCFCVTIFSLIFLFGNSASAQWGRIIHKQDSLYHRIFVYQNGSIATLRFGKQPGVQVQSQVNLDDLRQHMCEYTALTFCGFLYNPQPSRALVLGLGGGVIPREMRHYFPELEIDVAEIDSDIQTIAAKFFAFHEDDKLKVHIDDGRMFIKKRLKNETSPKYDIIVLDAFNGEYIPFHLMTREFLEEVKAILTDQGVVVANVFSNNRLFDAEFKTFLNVFGRCQVFTGYRSSNAMLVSPRSAAKTLTAEQALKQATILQQKYRFSFDMVMVAGRLQTDIRPNLSAKVLTDDLAPVNYLKEQKENN